MPIQSGYKQVAAYDEWGDKYYHTVPIDTPTTMGHGQGTNAYGDRFADPVAKKAAPAPAPKEEASAPAHAPSSGGFSAPRPSNAGGSGSGNSLVDALFKKIDELTGQKANEAIDGDPYGIEDTRLNQLSPERVRRSFLSNAGGQSQYSYNQVVNPATGEVYDSVDAAKSAGITNWVYKFQYDRKYQTPSLIEGGVEAQVVDGQSTAQQSYKWRNRYTTNQWYT